MRNIFGQRLSELLSEHGMTKRALAQAIRVSAMSVTDWTVNNVQPSAENIYSIAMYFHVSADYLLGLENDAGDKLYSQPQ